MDENSFPVSAPSKPAGRRLVALVAATFAVLAALSSSLHAQSCAPPPSGIVGWWGGEGDGSDTLSLNTAELQGAVTFVNAMVGKGFSLDGVSGAIVIPSPTNLNLGTNGGFTVELWVNPASVATMPLVEWNNGAGAIGVHLWISQPTVNLGGGPGCLFGNLMDTGGNYHTIATAANVVNANSFQHIAFTYDAASGSAKLFYNGSSVASANLGSFTLQTTYNVCLGNRPASWGQSAIFFGGVLDEISFYKRALSAAEIQAIFTAGAAGKCPLPPALLVQPHNQTILVGQSAEFSSEVIGSRPLSYQWQLDGTNLMNATNSTLTVTNAQPASAGAYSLTLTNLAGSATSSNAVLTVIVPTCLPLPAGLAGFWQGEGDASDSMGLNPGQLHGTMFFTNGEAGRGFGFDGVSGYVSIPAAAALNVGTNAGFTIECWINPADVLAPHALVEWNNGWSSLGSHLWISQGTTSFGGGPGCLFANLIDSTGVYHTLSSTGGIVTSNVFQHVAVTYDKSTGVGSLYYNGALVAGASLGMFSPSTSFDLYFGVRASGGAASPFSGVLDDVSLYTRALSADEIARIYYASSLGKCPFAPTVVAQPQSWTGLEGANATLSAGVSGSRPLAYAWYYNGTALPGLTAASFTLSNVQPSQAGTYSLAATNALGLVLSSNAAIKVEVVSVYANNQLLTNSSYVFGNSVTIEMTNCYADGAIFYTLDGSVPDFNSAIYTGSFTLTSSCVVRTLGFSSDFYQSAQCDPINIQVVPTYTLATSTGGGGTISVSPTNQMPLLANTVVSLTASPNPGWTFLQWLGDAAGTNPTTTVLMTRSKAVEAVFGTTLRTTAAGGGSVVLNPGGGLYPFGTAVQIIAVPQTGSAFELWGNAASGRVNPLTFYVTNANLTVSSLFSALSPGQFGLAVVPVGDGRVGISPQNNAYASGATATLTAFPASGQTFVDWTGDASGSSNPLSVTMSQSRTIFAHFSHNSSLNLQILPLGFSEGVQLTLTGDLGGAYRLDTSSNLLVWMPGIPVTNTSGTLQFIDTTATNAPLRFYRGIQVSP